MSKHTEGPWTSSILPPEEAKYQAGIEISGANGETVLAGCGCCGSPFGDNLEHDGPLMTAAPELLAVLKETVAAYGKPGGPWNVPNDPGGWLERARAAIAKAEGRS